MKLLGKHQRHIAGRNRQHQGGGIQNQRFPDKEAEQQRESDGQQYLPDEIRDARFYEPGENGQEKKIREWMEFLRRDG